MSVVSVRLLASPERIRRELEGSANQELGLLRALWRVAGERLNTGAVVDLDGLPPGLGARAGAAALLDALQSRQFVVWERLGSGLRLADPAAPVSAFRIDWPLIDKRRASEMSKLDAVQKYAYTKACRRGFVLRYFGDPAARPKCDGCDNCLGITVAARPKAQGGAPKSETGSRARGRGVAVSAVTAPDEPELSSSDQRLLASLKEKRLEIARREKVPAYIVFSDRTLVDMALRKPSSLGALAGVRGVGEMKLARYGEDFLAVVRSADETEAA